MQLSFARTLVVALIQAVAQYPGPWLLYVVGQLQVRALSFGLNLCST